VKAAQRALKGEATSAWKSIEGVETDRSLSVQGIGQGEGSASSTDPEARIMLQANGAYGPAYNVQISTDAQSKIIVGVG